MGDGELTPFGYFFPQQSVVQTRVLITRHHPVLPDDEYALLESYCPNAACNCRRVMLNVVAKRQQVILASIGYGFDRDDEFAGPLLDPLNPQSEYAEVLLTLVAGVLADPDYVARLEAHYYQVKGIAAERSCPSRSTPSLLLEGAPVQSQSRRVRRKAKKRK